MGQIFCHRRTHDLVCRSVTDKRRQTVVDVAQGKELSVVVHITVSKTVIQDLLQQTEDSLRLIAGELKGGHWLRDMGFTGQSDQTVST